MVAPCDSTCSLIIRREAKRPSAIVKKVPTAAIGPPVGLLVEPQHASTVVSPAVVLVSPNPADPTRDNTQPAPLLSLSCIVPQPAQAPQLGVSTPTVQRSVHLPPKHTWPFKAPHCGPSDLPAVQAVKFRGYRACAASRSLSRCALTTTPSFRSAASSAAFSDTSVTPCSFSFFPT